LVAEPIKRDGADYREASRRGIWTEHGRESLDLDGALAALADSMGASSLKSRLPINRRSRRVPGSQRTGCGDGLGAHST
jgi:hypothetical protein